MTAGMLLMGTYSNGSVVVINHTKDFGSRAYGRKCSVCNKTGLGKYKSHIARPEGRLCTRSGSMFVSCSRSWPKRGITYSVIV